MGLYVYSYVYNRKFSQRRSLRLVTPEGGMAHNHDQRVGYLAYTAVIQLQPAAMTAPSNSSIITCYYRAVQGQ